MPFVAMSLCTTIGARFHLRKPSAVLPVVARQAAEAAFQQGGASTADAT